MESNGELFFDQLSQTPTGPQLAGKAIVEGGVRQPTQDDLLLSPRQFRRPATDSPRYESSLTLVAKGRNPATHAGGIDAQEIRHLLGGIPVDNALNGQSPSSLQFDRCPFWSHTRNTHPMDKRALLS